ncbi:hypothetical protein EDD59_103131 [Muricomes intestini]|jgi:hypothetical protein|uniref:Uncharacterized protein n=1 Tax=Muricomes intestini TaxID=1796634 RepID=A0A4R3KF95_9FIRM|nr:hypothetical protein [Muricomes intestini]TCS81713.1 hypothetical protein EDD59_103131 [Muricomes intestini]
MARVRKNSKNATANLKQLLNKRDAIRKEELIAAVEKSGRSYEEILAFLNTDSAKAE